MPKATSTFVLEQCFIHRFHLMRLFHPIVILNHRDPTQWEPSWVWVGANRVWAARQLGWTHVRALVTGHCPHPSVEVPWERIQDYTVDGEFYVDRNGWLKLRGMTDFKKGEFPCG